MRRVTKPVKWLTAAALVLTAGCVSLPWVPAEPQHTVRSGHFSVELPQGWMRWNHGPADEVLVTRDGEMLQQILVERVPVDAELRHTKKRLARGMLSQEAAEVVIDNYASDRSNLDFEVRENSPTKVAGFPGFRVTFTYRTRDGLRIKTVYYGFVKDDALYGIRYTAPQRYYFDKDIKSFEQVLQSFKLLKTA